MAAIDSFYSNYLSTYGGMNTSRYDTHKKSELRNTYNSIVKINKDSPFYKINDVNDVKGFAIDIKEKARGIQNIVSSLSDSEEGIEQAFKKKIAISSNPDVVSVDYIDDGKSFAAGFDIEVSQMATAQMNLGNFLNSNTSDFPPGNYSFDLNTTSNSYEFQYMINSSDKNSDIQNKIASLINNAEIGLTASICNDNDHPARNALKITSNQVGLDAHSTEQFRISAEDSAQSDRALTTLGIGRVSSPASNAEFSLNGNPHTSYSNDFTINQVFHLTLNGISEKGHPTTIGFKPDADAIIDNVQELVGSYNSIILTALDYSDTQTNSVELMRDISSVIDQEKNDFDSLGLTVNDNHTITLDKNLLTSTLNSEHSSELYSSLADFKDRLGEKALQASLNPMKYVNKVMVFYRNPVRNFVSAYVTSIYSGMLLDSYV